MQRADIGSDHFMVKVEYKQKIAVRQRDKRGVKIVSYRREVLNNEEKQKAYAAKVTQLLERNDGMKDSLQGKWNRIKAAVTTAAEEIIGRSKKAIRNDWYDEEYAKAVHEKNEARKIMLQRMIRSAKE